MWTLEDPSPELGHGFCILTFKKHAYNITFGNWHFRESECRITGTLSPSAQLQGWIHPASTRMRQKYNMRKCAGCILAPIWSSPKHLSWFPYGRTTITSENLRIGDDVVCTVIEQMCARKRFLIWRIYTMTEQRFPAGSCTIRIQAERSCWSTPAFKLHFVAAGLKTFAPLFVTDVCWYVGAQFQFQLDSTPWVFSDYHRKYFIELKSACLRWPWIFFPFI